VRQVCVFSHAALLGRPQGDALARAPAVARSLPPRSCAITWDSTSYAELDRPARSGGLTQRTRKPLAAKTLFVSTT